MKRKTLTLLRLALPYLLCIMLPLAAIAFLSSTLSLSYRERAVEKETETIEHAFEGFAGTMNMAKELADALSNTRVVTSYAYDTYKGVPQSFLDGKELQDILKTFLINDIASVAYYYDLHNDRVISPYGVLSDSSLFFSYDYRMEGFSAQDAIRRVREGGWGRSFFPALNIAIPSTAAEMIEYHQSIPVSMTRGFTGRLVLALKTENLMSELFACTQDGGAFFIYDSSGNLFYASGEKYRDLVPAENRLVSCSVPGGEEVFGISLKSAGGEWTARVFTRDVLWRAGAWNHWFVWVIVILLILLSLVICIFFTMKNKRELEGILQSLRISADGRETGSDYPGLSFQVIREYAEKLAAENSAFIRNMDEFQKSRQNELLLRLFRHDWEEKAEIRQLADDGKLSLPDSGKFAVLLVHFDGPGYRMQVSENMTARDLVKDLIMTFIYEPFSICDISSREFAFLIMPGREGNCQEYLRNLASRINVEVKYKYDISLQIGISDIGESVFDADLLYRQAGEVIQYCEASQHEIALYSDFANLQDVYYYPPNSAEKMRNFIAVGKAEEAKEILRGIYHVNFEQHTDLSANAIRSVRELVQKNLTDAAGYFSLSCDTALSGPEQDSSIQAFFQTAEAQVDRITAQVLEKNGSNDRSPMAKIMDHISRNYCDSDLSLKSLSREFGLSESYISTMFKASYGKSLSSFIEECRIRKASELLANTGRKISDIAQETGYSSDTSFRRAFKKVTGLSPVEYKTAAENRKVP